MGLQEYDRAAHAVAACDGDCAFFVAYYARYLAGQRRREVAAVELIGGRSLSLSSLSLSFLSRPHKHTHTHCRFGSPADSSCGIG